MIIDFKEDLAYVMSLLRLELQSKLEAQGHGKKGRSKLIDSIEYEIVSAATILIGNMYLEDYYIFVEKGVKAGRIPYSRKRSGGGTSKYIQALIKFWKRKGLSAKKAKSAAFATANKHKKEGMPSSGSFRFSKDGTRTGFVASTLKNYEKKAFEILERRTGDRIEMTLTNMLLDLQTQIQ